MRCKPNQREGSREDKNLDQNLLEGLISVRDKFRERKAGLESAVRR